MVKKNVVSTTMAPQFVLNLPANFSGNIYNGTHFHNNARIQRVCNHSLSLYYDRIDPYKEAAKKTLGPGPGRWGQGAWRGRAGNRKYMYLLQSFLLIFAHISVETTGCGAVTTGQRGNTLNFYRSQSK